MRTNLIFCCLVGFLLVQQTQNAQIEQEKFDELMARIDEDERESLDIRQRKERQRRNIFLVKLLLSLIHI